MNTQGDTDNRLYLPNLYIMKFDLKQLKLLATTPYDELQTVFPGVPRRTLLSMKRKYLDNLSVEERIKMDIDKLKDPDLPKRYKATLNQVKELERMVEEAFKLKNPLQTFKIEPHQSSGTSEAVAFIIASDWHVEEKVESGTINGLNKFNLEIADQRTTEFFKNALRLLNMVNKDVKIKEVVLALLGDFISGNIHDEIVELALLGPGDAIWKAQNIIISGINFLLENTDYNFIIPCAPGNHSRITQKQRHATEQANSLETYMYRNLAMHYKDNKRVKFVLSEGYHTYLDCYGYTVRLHHGHSLNYGGGVGGLTIPVNKAIAQWNKSRPAYLDVFGHWHQFMDGGNFICNGSLIGYNAYALSIKAGFEKPKQTFFLLDKKRGKTVVCPISFKI